MAYRAVFMSDIHGNLPALEAVRRSLPEHDAVYVAGDLCLRIVGRGRRVRARFGELAHRRRPD